MARPKQLPSGAWQVRWRDPTGKQRKQTFRRKMDATDFTRDIEYDVAHGSYTDPNAGKITLDDWWKQWIAARQHLKPKTLARATGRCTGPRSSRGSDRTR